MTSTYANSQKRVSHPVGTTVSVADFLANLPVRRQIAIKEKVAITQLSRIKRTLQAYAIARPHVRFSLKVLKSKSEKGNWSYAPKKSSLLDYDRSALIRDAATKIFGRKLLDDCQSLTWTSADNEAEHYPRLEPDTVPSGAVYELEALLPKAGCSHDFSDLPIPRQYLSIDSRPMACKGGTLKQVVSLFKRYYKSAALGIENNTSTDPFLYLNFVCPRGSYDANIEPAKDDVLFEDSITILTLAERFFSHIYGELAAATDHSASISSKQIGPRTDLLLATDRVRSISSSKKNTGRETHHPATLTGDSEDADDRQILCNQSPTIHDESSNTRSLPLNSRRFVGRLMCDDEIDGISDFEPLDDEHHSLLANEDQREIATLDDVSVSNPWAITKFNACLRKPANNRSTTSLSSSPSHLPTPKQQRGDLSMSAIAVPASLLNSVDDAARQLPSPGRSSSPLPFPYPIKARAKRQEGDVSRAGPCAELENVPHDDLDSSVQPSHSNHMIRSSQDTGESRLGPRLNGPYGNNFVSARSLPQGTPLSDIPEISQRAPRRPGPQKQKLNGLHKPFISPVNDPERVWFDNGQRRGGRQQRQNHSPHSSSYPNEIDALNLREDEDDNIPTPSTSTTKDIHPDLALTLDYEARKQQATQEYKANVRRQALTKGKALLPKNTLDNFLQTSKPPSNSPHNNRYLKAKAALQPSHHLDVLPSHHLPSKEPFIHPNDPRALLIHDQAHAKTTDPPTNKTPHRPRSRSRRARTALLPLESVAEEDSVRELLLSLATSPSECAAAVDQARSWDAYVADGDISEALGEVDEGVARMWQDGLEKLVTEKFGPARDSQGSGDEGGGGGGGGGVRIDVLGAIAGLRSRGGK